MADETQAAAGASASNLANTQGANSAPSSGGQQDAAHTQAQAAAEKTFTQAEFNRHLKQRLDEERAKYADYDDLKKKAEALEAANKSELEKAIEKANRLEARQKEMEAQTRERVITAEAKQIAATLGFSKPEKAIKLADLSQVTYGEDGTVSGVKEALEALAADMPELLTKTTAPQTGAANPARTGANATETDAQKRARLMGGGASLDFFSGGRDIYYPKTGE